jgi:hypothetical protein
MFVADTFSRAFLPETKEDLELDISVKQRAHLAVAPQEYMQFKKITAEDLELQTLKMTVENGWPDVKDEVPYSIHKYWDFREEISCIQGIL